MTLAVTPKESSVRRNKHCRMFSALPKAANHHDGGDRRRRFAQPTFGAVRPTLDDRAHHGPAARPAPLSQIRANHAAAAFAVFLHVGAEP